MVPTFSRSGDKRRTVRGRVKLSARYISPNLNLEGQVTDVSSEGLFFCSDYLDDQGEMARVLIEGGPGGRPIELRGEVRWVSDRTHGGGMGLRLIDVSIEDRVLLAKVVGAGGSLAAIDDSAVAGAGSREGNA